MRAGLSRRSASARPLPMEDVILFAKAIDNSALRRPSDPSDRLCWRRTLSVGFVMLLLALVCFGPRAWLRHSGRGLVDLAERRDELLDINRHLTIRQAQLSDLRRVGRLASSKGLAAPPPENYTWQDRTIEPAEAGSSLALSLAQTAD